MIKFVSLFAFLALIAMPVAALAAAQVGQPAPDFTATAIDGTEIKLSDHKGSKIILEWTNHECPFVKKHYETGNMQEAQKMAVEKGVKWISIVSSAPGKQGNVDAGEAQAIIDETDAHPTAKILDPSGEIGNLYGAKTTPHMFLIDEEGTLVYAGAIDDNSSSRHDTVEGAKNYVLAALSDLEAGNPVAEPVTAPYGCSVKY